MRAVYEDTEQRTADDMRLERESLEARFGYRTVGLMMAAKLKEIAG